MSELLRPVPLSFDEILRLDGLVNPDAQVIVTRVKTIASLGGDTPENRLLAGLIEDARTIGALTYRSTWINDCRLCGFSGEYPKYKSGRNRGSVNYDKGRTGKYGVELAVRFVSVKGSVAHGGCKECIEKLTPRIIQVLADIPCQLPPQLKDDGRAVYRVSPTMLCPCGWAGHEEEMKKARTLMGDGWYPAGCPSCGAENTFVRTAIKTDHKSPLLMDMGTRQVFPVGTSLSDLREPTKDDAGTRPGGSATPGAQHQKPAQVEGKSVREEL